MATSILRSATITFQPQFASGLKGIYDTSAKAYGAGYKAYGIQRISYCKIKVNNSINPAAFAYPSINLIPTLPTIVYYR